MHKAVVTAGLVTAAEGYYVWVNDNLGSALWFLLAVVAINLVATIYTRGEVRTIPQNIANYAVSIAGTVFASNHMILDTNYVKALMILLLFHEMSVTAPVVLAAMKKLGFSQGTADQIVVSAEQYAMMQSKLTAADNKMNEPLLPPETQTGKQ